MQLRRARIHAGFLDHEIQPRPRPRHGWHQGPPRAPGSRRSSCGGPLRVGVRSDWDTGNEPLRVTYPEVHR
jgi:hypothetical protein